MFILLSELIHLYAGDEPSDVEVEQLLQDVEKCTLASHLFWGLWGIISVLTSLLILISFIRTYQKKKKNFLHSNRNTFRHSSPN